MTSNEQLRWADARFALAWLLPLTALAAAWHSAWAAWLAMLGVQLGVAVLERAPSLQASPAASASSSLWHRVVVRGHVVLQFALQGACLYFMTAGGWGWVQAIALGIAVGSVSGGQGITFAHELGHSRSRFDRLLAWLLMSSVNYCHFMVEHYRGHHVRAATHDDPASARLGETLWRFLPRTLVGSFASAWALEAQRLRQFKRAKWQSPLVWASVAQVLWLALLALWLGWAALVFWCVQAAYAVFLLETINYIEHYGLQRQTVNGKTEPFAMQHAWNADHVVTNAILVNLQRHSDHHMHAWKPYATLQDLPGPQLPTGYAGCIFLATVPRLWFAVMHRRLQAFSAPQGAG